MLHANIFSRPYLVFLSLVALGPTWNAAVAGEPRPAPVDVRIDSDRAVISNKYLSLDIPLAEKLRPATIVRNLRSNKTLPLNGVEFSIDYGEPSRILHSSQFHMKSVHQETVGSGGKRLTLEFAGEKLRVRMVTQLHPDQWWATRWLEMGGAGQQLNKVNLGRWGPLPARAPIGLGKTFSTLGMPSGHGQVAYVGDFFIAIAHPGAENVLTPSGISCSIGAYEQLAQDKPVTTPKLVIGASEAFDVRRSFLRYIDRTRAVPSRMIFLVNDWYWKDKSKPLQALEALVRVKQQSGVPVDSFTLDDGWDFDWDEQTKIWGRLGRQRFPGGWDALQAAARPADINISLWFGPIGGYRFRPKRIEFARTVDFEIQNGKLCLAGPRYREHVIESFSMWAEQGMDYIKVDGFWPNCQETDHGHPVGPSGTIAQMDALIDVFAAWHRARPNLLIGYTSGSNPSPFWLQHADFVWRGGRDDSHAGVGEPFDRHNTYLDSILQAHRETNMPMSAFVTFDIVQGRIHGNRDDVFERGCWWLAARTSLHHDWYIQASDLSLDRWKTLARAARWAKAHEQVFRFSRMVGGDPNKGELYGFSAFDKGRGTLALRNPSDEPRWLEGSLARLLDLPSANKYPSFKLKGVYGETNVLEGIREGGVAQRMELPPLKIAVFEVEQLPSE